MMGMFDSFYGKFVCPKCGYTVNHKEFQTKALDCCLEGWEIGDRVNSMIESGRIPCHNSLVHKCKKGWTSYWIDALAIIKDYKFKEIQVVTISHEEKLKVVSADDNRIILTNKDGSVTSYFYPKEDMGTEVIFNNTKKK